MPDLNLQLVFYWVFNARALCAPARPAALAAASSKVRYRVQLLVSDKKYTSRSSIFKKLGGPVEQEPVIINRKRFNKYIWGNYRTEPEAGVALRKAKRLGFHDAFVVPYKNGLRLDAQL